MAGRAGVSPETVYKAFGGKTGLVKALWDVTLADDDEPLPMGGRPALLEVWRDRDPQAKVRLYAAFVRGRRPRRHPAGHRVSTVPGGRSPSS